MSRTGWFILAACLGAVVAGALWLVSFRRQVAFINATQEDVRWGLDDHPVAGGTSAHFGAWGDGFAYIVWTDRAEYWAGGGGSEQTADRAHARYHYIQRALDGPDVEFQYEMNETRKGREVKMTINGAPYDLAKGSLFIVRARGNRPEVVQLNRELHKLKPGKAALEELATNDAEVAAILTRTTREFAPDIELLGGAAWRNPAFHGQLLFGFSRKNSTECGLLLSYAFRGTGFTRIGELKAKDDKRFIVFAETRKDRRAVVEIAYEIDGDKLKLSCPEKLPVLGLAEPFDVSGEWQRHPIDRK